MIYPVKKQSFSPEPKKTKDLKILPNINSKFIGTGGNPSSLAPKKQLSQQKPKKTGIFECET